MTMSSSVRPLVTIGATASLIALMLFSLPAGASASDKDCADFPTQRAAQVFFLKHGGPRRDPDRLDADNDGVACEDNPCPCYRGTRLPHRAQLSVFAEGRPLRGRL